MDYNSDRRATRATEAASLSQLLTLSVNEVQLSADIGVLPHEIGTRQPLIADVTLHLTCLSPSRIEDTVDYTLIVEAALRLSRQRIDLIETFALRLAEACLDDSRVATADVRIRKPKALANGMASARVVLGRSASSGALPEEQTTTADLAPGGPRAQQA